MELAAHNNQFHFHPYPLSNNFEKQQVYYFIVSTTSQHQFLQLYIQLISELSLEYLSVDPSELIQYSDYNYSFGLRDIPE